MRLMSLATFIAATVAYVTAKTVDECIPPYGNYKQSCDSISISPYTSTDPLVPDACELKATCATNFAGLPPVENSVYFPMGHALVDVENKNGTLAYNGRALAFSTMEQLDSQPCNMDFIQGSYAQTCKVTSNDRYKSSDERLLFTKLCEVKTSCRTLDGSSSSNLIFFDAQRETTRFENCNGKLKEGLDDQECQNVPHDEIKRISDVRCSNQLKI